MPRSSSSSDDKEDDPDFRVDSSDDEPDYRAATPDDDAEAADIVLRMPADAATPDDDTEAADVVLRMPVDAESVVSILRTQDQVDAVCKKYGVPKEQYPARPAGDLRASSSPPPGSVCVYAHALEAGMRVPLHPFFCGALVHFGIAPTQLAPNGWRIMAGFVVLCHFAGVPPSLAVFLHFFRLRVLNNKKKDSWHRFQCRDNSALRFTGLPDSIKGWKESFFFLSSPAPWPCPVEWGEPPKSSFMAPKVTGEEKRSVDTLLRVHGGAPVDIRTYLRDSSLAAAMIPPASPLATAPPPPLPLPFCTPTSAITKGMDPSVYGMMKSIRAEKAASAHKVKSEPGGDGLLRGKKRSLEEADGEVEEGPPSAHGSSVPDGACSPPPGFSRKRTRFPSGNDDDGDSTDWEAALELLRSAVSPRQNSLFAASRPSDIVRRCVVAQRRSQDPNHVGSELKNSQILSSY